MQARVSPGNGRRLFVTDKEMKRDFLIDTGADISVIQCTNIRQGYKRSTYELEAATDSVIDTYGIADLCPDLRLPPYFLCHLVVSGFPTHYGLLVDLRNNQLIDGKTNCTFRGYVSVCDVPSVNSITLDESTYHQLLAELP